MENEKRNFSFMIYGFDDLIDDCYYLEGKSLAQSRDAKFIETSSGIQHNVDELLVGILKQVGNFSSTA